MPWLRETTFARPHIGNTKKTEEANEDLLEHQWLHIKVAGMAAKLLDTGNLPHRRGLG